MALRKSLVMVTLTATALASCVARRAADEQATAPVTSTGALVARQDPGSGAISVYRAGRREPVLTQQAPPHARPYMHPIVAPDGAGVLTELSPAHHKHQTGLYWGFTRVNGRDYFHNPGEAYWRRVSATVLQASGEDVRWQTVYDLLDEAGNAIMTESQRWSMREQNGRFLLDLTWRGEAKTAVTIGQHDYGGLFLRMPWRSGLAAEVVNAARQRNARAEGQRAMWIDIGMQVDGRRDLAHIAIFDHPGNRGHPQAWRVDDQFGVGAAPTRGGDWTIGKGRTEVLRHQFVIYTGALKDIEMTTAWAEFAGNRSLYSTAALWGIAQKEGREAQFLTPQDAVAQMSVASGYAVNPWAAEPDIAQPMAFCWDDRGRLWVAENRDYETRGRGFSGAGTSKILILEDTDRDGVADSRKVFMEGLAFPAAIAVGLDGVFVGAPPNLLFVPDRNKDDRADTGDIEVRLTGWGIRDRHETINSLHWGPDGWLYGLQGYATSSKIRKPQGKGRLYGFKDPFPEDLLKGDGVDLNGGVWRYHPTKDLFEVVAHGFSNPWGIDYDAKGQLLISACVIPHLWHVVPGGIYHRQGGQHFNPYVYDDLKTIADHRHRSAHGGARVYQSDAFPASQQGRIFMANIHEHAVLSDVLVRKGSGFTAHHGEDFMLANNAQWIGFSLEIGPDGALYVLDWHDADICGQAVMHGETGRIYRIAPARSLAQDWPGRYGDVAALSDRQLVDLQTSRSDWHARRARIVLQGRAAKRTLQVDTHERLRALYRSSTNGDVRLRAMWALHVTGGWTADALAQALDDRDAYVRAWAIQLLTEDRSASTAALDAFVRMAKDDESPVVRLYLASALQRMPSAARWRVASELMAHAQDAADHNLPTMIWLGIEPLVAENPSLALERVRGSRIPLVARFTARRTVDANAVDVLIAAIGRSRDGAVHLLEGMRDAFEGRNDIAPPAGWPALYERLKRADARTARLAGEIAEQFGDAAATTRNLATVRDTSAAPDDRRRAIQLLALQRRPQLVAELPRALADPRIRAEAVRAIAAFEDDGLAKALLDRYADLSAAEKIDAIQTLATRPRYGRLLTDAIAGGAVPRRDVPPHLARQLARVVGTPFVDAWGSVDAGAPEEDAYARYRALLSEGALASANVVNGRRLYDRTCGSCHLLNGVGGAIGPDLTGSNRGNVEYLLFNVLNPNGEVPDAYKMQLVTTRDGRTFAGTVASETDRQLTLRVVGRDPIVIATAEIQSRESSTVSMMPPGLFDALTEREVIDLVGFLRTAGPIKGEGATRSTRDR